MMLANTTDVLSDRLASTFALANEHNNLGLAFCILMLRNHVQNGTIEKLADVIGNAHGMHDWRIFISNVIEE